MMYHGCLRRGIEEEKIGIARGCKEGFEGKQNRLRPCLYFFPRQFNNVVLLKIHLIGFDIPEYTSKIMMPAVLASMGALCHILPMEILRGVIQLPIKFHDRHKGRFWHGK